MSHSLIKRIFFRGPRLRQAITLRSDDKLDIPSEPKYKSAYSAVKKTKQLDSASKNHIICCPESHDKNTKTAQTN